ncbi:hypothetical protein MWU78_21940 [Arenibacter sp. F26102]|uniref:hypothetical protein n=1 Tax=Arenibacter sp. F26102 TaxID=2926416 RepID=UPI001FF4B272|nr:hypothetical protein [Arenibacter sp. F26102]MCK0148320.1 hypothetical protein [Arenibacter sp. F26102]
MGGHNEQAISGLGSFLKEIRLEWAGSSLFRVEVTFQHIQYNISLRESCAGYATHYLK